MQACFLSMLALAVGTAPLLDTSDQIDGGATVVYTVSIVEGIDYWVVLGCDEPSADLDIVIASREMDFDRFMSLPYYEDFLYAGEFALASGTHQGSEDLTLSAPYTGVAYVVVHDIGETGGHYQLRIY
ncbi:hypothetical protein JW921_01170 [Candidatus Fermentibacterales bacterium]|nr:hypothetical protein [Candidatus Fermentibacterales bacterium]